MATAGDATPHPSDLSLRTLHGAKPSRAVPPGTRYAATTASAVVGFGADMQVQFRTLPANVRDALIEHAVQLPEFP